MEDIDPFYGVFESLYGVIERLCEDDELLLHQHTDLSGRTGRCFIQDETWNTHAVLSYELYDSMMEWTIRPYVDADPDQPKPSQHLQVRYTSGADIRSLLAAVAALIWDVTAPKEDSDEAAAVAVIDAPHEG